MKILAIDCATSLGWAFGDSAGDPISGFVESMGPDRDGKYSGCIRWMTNMMNEHKPDRIAIEAPFVSEHTSFKQMELAYGMQACLLGTARRKGCLKVSQPAVNSIRSVFIPQPPLPKGEKRPKLDGDQKKLLVRRRCLELGWITEDDTNLDQTDALAVWAYTVSKYDQPNGIRFLPLFTKA